MPRITSGAGWDALLRAHLNALREAGQRPVANPATSRAASSPLPPSKQTAANQARKPDAAQDPEQVLLAQVRAIPPDDPDRQKKAFRIFMESVLKREFSAYLQPADDLGKLVDQVIAQMDEDPELTRAAMTAAERLLTKASDQSR